MKQPKRDFVRLVSTDTGISVHDSTGVRIAKLSKSAVREWQEKLATFRIVRILGLIQRKATDPEEGFQSRLRVERWEVPLLEVVYAESLVS